MKIPFLILLAIAGGCAGADPTGSGGTTTTQGTGGPVSAPHCPDTACAPNATESGTFIGTTDCGCGTWHCFCGSDGAWHECCCPKQFSEDPACSEEH